MLLFTDFESDDGLAMHILEKRGLLPSTIVVTESVREITIKKAQMIKQIFPQCTVYVGASSDKTYDNFVTDSTVIVQDMPQNLLDHKYGTIICLSPPRDLYRHWRTHPTIFRNTDLWIYGGFNLRTMKGKIDVFMNTAFANVYLFETTGVLWPRNICWEYTPKLMTHMNSIPWLMTLINMWNENIKRQSLIQIQTSKSTESVNRSHQIDLLMYLYSS